MGQPIRPQRWIASELAMGGEALMELLTDESKIENQNQKLIRVSLPRLLRWR